MNELLNFVIVTHDDTLIKRVESVLQEAGISARGQQSRIEELGGAASSHHFGLCLVEDRLCDQPRDIVHTIAPEGWLVMICDASNERAGIRAVDAGFDDYLLNDNLHRLSAIVRRWRRNSIRRGELAVSSLSESEERCREMFRLTTDAFAFFEVLGGRRFLLEGLNPAAERLLGVSADECSGKCLPELLPEGVVDVVLRSFQRTLETRGITNAEQCWELATGTRWLHAMTIPIQHPGQLPHRLAVVWRDVTDQKNYEKTLIDREETFRRLVETTNVIPWEADYQTGRFLYVGPQAVKRFGYSEAEWLSEGFWANHVHPEDRAGARETRQRISTNVSEYEFEYRILAKSGECVWVHDLVNVVLDSRGKILLRGFFVDVTARRKAEEEVRRLNAELERRVAERTAQLAEANRELEAFSYSVSHDLRAPLRAIDGFSKALLEDYSEVLDSVGQAMLRRVRNGSQRMGELIDDLLTLSRISRSEMRTTTVDLSQIARSIAKSLQATAPQRQVEWVIADHLTAEGDGALLRVVLENLLGNAWKYTARNATARIEFGSRPREESSEFFVRDDGAGFDPAYAGKLFQPFQRLHHNDEFEGHGIGLATVQRILHRHRGRIRADGVVGKGATFYFTLGPPPEAS